MPGSLAPGKAAFILAGMGSAQVNYTLDISAPIARVFTHIADHEGMANWPGVSACHLQKPGTPRNGLGAVRAIRARGLTLLEKVVHFQPPQRLDYTIIKGLPISHLGSVRLASTDQGTRLTWSVHMSSRIPLLAQIVGGMLRRGLPGALAYVKDQAERSASVRM